jgi:CRP-like cAMP-binding protein
MLVDAARSTPGIVEDPPPFAQVTQIADPVVDYETSMWIEDYSLAPQVEADFGALVWYLSYRHDVPLPNPAQDVYFFDGAKAAIESRVTAAEVRQRIADIPLVAALDDDALDKLAAVASINQYRSGETIIEEGTQRDLLLMHSGRARLVLRRADLEDLNVVDIEAGEAFGVLSESPVSDRALVVATTDCEVLRIPPEGAGRAIAIAPDLANVLDQLAATRRRRIERVLRRSGRDAGPTGAESRKS